VPIQSRPDWAEKVKSEVISNAITQIISGAPSENGGTGDAASAHHSRLSSAGRNFKSLDHENPSIRSRKSSAKNPNQGPTEFRIKGAKPKAKADGPGVRISANYPNNTKEFSDQNYFEKNRKTSSSVRA